MSKVSDLDSDNKIQLPNKRKVRAARIATGGKQARLLRRNALPMIRNDKARLLWSILRTAVMEKRSSMTASVFVLNDVFLESVTVRQGFLLKHVIRHDQSLMIVDHHVSNTKRLESSDDESSQMKPLAFMAFDRIHRMVFWEFKQLEKVKFNGVFKGMGDVSHFICIQKSNLFIACYLDEVIKFYDLNLGFINDFRTNHEVQFIRYNESLNSLLLIGVHHVTVYSILGLTARDSKINLLFLNEFVSPFRKENWIKAVVLQEKTFQISIAIGTNLVVYNYSTGKVIENIVNATDRPITCIQYHHFYGYTILGTTSGQGNIMYYLLLKFKF